jgi:hypothetical protein
MSIILLQQYDLAVKAARTEYKAQSNARLEALKNALPSWHYVDTQYTSYGEQYGMPPCMLTPEAFALFEGEGFENVDEEWKDNNIYYLSTP